MASAVAAAAVSAGAVVAVALATASSALVVISTLCCDGLTSTAAKQKDCRKRRVLPANASRS